MSTIKWSEGAFTNKRGKKIYTQQWDLQAPKAIVVLLHGYASHSHWYTKDTAIRIANAGYASFALDHEGHGKSEGLQAYWKCLDDIAEDAIQFLEYARNLYPRKECYIYGESLGGAVSLFVSLKRPELLDGIILSAPLSAIPEDLKPNFLAVGVIKGVAYLFPEATIIPADNVPLEFKYESDRQKAKADPMFYSGNLRAKTGVAFLRDTEYLQANFSKITHPIFIMHGTNDKITPYEMSEKLFEECKSTDKTLYLYTDEWHILNIGPNAKDIDHDVEEWLNARIVSPQTCSITKHIKL